MSSPTRRERNNFVAGPKTVKDIWELLPFENYLVTAGLTPEEIKAVMEEVFVSREPRNLLGFPNSNRGKRFRTANQLDASDRRSPARAGQTLLRCL
ncbi:MAG: 5'-nucleotidase C-terminal domain-containing protein [Verrucomicrobia bacterium]|nr:5'-nucleotidase C-terminal domain-containing protein [Verrucomicrobiota bacterium]